MDPENVERTARLLRDSTAPLDPANIDAGVDPDLARLALDWFGALARGDLEWVLAHTEPDIEIARRRCPTPVITEATRAWLTRSGTGSPLPSATSG